MIKSIIYLVSSVFLLVLVQPRLEDSNNKTAKSLPSHLSEVLYFPNGKALNAISFDYKTVLANILWFNTVNYFGKHYRQDQKYTWLSHMCNLVTDLDSKAMHVFEFCSLMLTWETNQVEKAQELLDKAIKLNPTTWRYYYLRGVNYAIFVKDAKLAQADFEYGAKLPDSPPFMTRLATKTLSAISSPESAIAFLKSMLARAKNDSEREALKKHLDTTVHTYNLDKLEEMVSKFKTTNNRSPNDLSEVLPNSSFTDPYGGKYYWDTESETVKSTSNVARGTALVKK